MLKENERPRVPQPYGAGSPLRLCFDSLPSLRAGGAPAGGKRRAGTAEREPSLPSAARAGGAEPLAEFKAGALALSKSHSRNLKAHGNRRQLPPSLR